MNCVHKTPVTSMLKTRMRGSQESSVSQLHQLPACKTLPGSLISLSLWVTEKMDLKGPCNSLKESMEVRGLQFWLFGIIATTRYLKQGATLLEK